MNLRSQETKENRIHGSKQIPYRYYFCQIPEAFQNVALHWHYEMELSLILEGEGTFFLEGQTFDVKAGDLMIVTPNLMHAIEGHMVYDTLVFSGSFISTGPEERGYQDVLSPLFSGNWKLTKPISPNDAGYKDIFTACQNVFKYIHEDNSLADLMTKSELLRLIYFLKINDHFTRNENQDDPSALFRPVLLYIEEHYQEPISTNNLAKLIHVSPSYFHHRFTDTFGISPGNYVRGIRLNQACRLLADPDLPISQIAADTGYTNISNFNRQFKNRTGFTPKEYRNHIHSV